MDTLDAVLKVVDAAGLVGFMLIILFGGNGAEKAIWVYGWLYRQALADRDQARADAEKWQRAWIRMATTLDAAIDKAGAATALAEIAASSTKRQRDRDAETDD